MKRLSVFLLAFFLVQPALAQEEAPSDTGAVNPTFISSTYKCDWSELENIVEHDRQRMLPILQALVDEGVIFQAGEAVHHWGDEYNLLSWFAAPDAASGLAAWEEMVSRYQEAYPDDTFFIEHCPEHRDYFYSRRAATESDPPPVTEDNTPTLAISYYTCEYPEIGTLVEEERTRAMAIAQSLVDEGVLRSRAVYVHEWGNEWNYVVTQTASDLPALLSALDTFGERYEAEYGESSREVYEEHCSAHKDNIYTMVMATQSQ